MVSVSLVARSTPSGSHRYLLPLDIGSPSQRIEAMIDTGSSYLILRDLALGACTEGDAAAYGTCYSSNASLGWQAGSSTVPQSTGFQIDGYQVSFSTLAGRDMFGVVNTNLSLNVPLRRFGNASGWVSPLERLDDFMADAAGIIGLSPVRIRDPVHPWEVCSAQRHAMSDVSAGCCFGAS